MAPRAARPAGLVAVAVAVMAALLTASPAASLLLHGPRATAVAPLRRVALRMGLLDGLASGGAKAREPEASPIIERCRERAARVNALESTIETLTDAQLRAKTREFRQRLADGATRDSILEEAFAVVREAAWRVLDMRHYDVQLVAGMVLHEGQLAEMATGEGKTLVATLPTYLHALEGHGALVVTANEYLARRDAETVGQVHRFLGLSVGLVQAESTPDERQEAYGSDVTYITNSELGFDYLRDNLALNTTELTQARQPKFCLVDEADSILIDDARTPLVISKQAEGPKAKYQAAAKIAAVLREGEHFEVNEKEQVVTLTEQGFRDAQSVIGKDLFDARDPWAPFVLNAVKAKTLFQKDVNYIVRGEEIVIVDTFTGRVMEGRRWSDGLHQSLEAKEALTISGESAVVATVTYQALFRRFESLCGMTGTAMSDAGEFAKVYDLPVVRIPTALPVARRDYPDVVFKTQPAKVRAMVNEVVRVHEVGRPILIGTTSVADSDDIAALLREQGIEPLVLNAKPENCDREGETVSQAGRLGAVTVATNMAGRGTDILLGGSPSMMAKLRVRDGLVGVLDDEGRAAFAPLDASFYPCAISDQAQAALATAAAELLKDGALAQVDLEEFVAVASEKATLSDPAVLAIRQAFQLVKAEFAAVLKEEKEEVRKLGGLYVIGTERHESRRIDSQLRGRAGRQGDPGASRFFLSLDDRMLRLFGADRMKTVMDSFRVSEDTPLENKMVVDAIDKVQRGTEEYYAGIRDQVFQFDDVLATQRDSLYDRRSALLLADHVATLQLVKDYALATLEDIVPNFVRDGGGDGSSPAVDAAGLQAKVEQFFPGVAFDGPALASAKTVEDATAQLQTAVAAAVASKQAQLDAFRPGQFTRVAKYLGLLQFDNCWCDHLKNMNLLKETVMVRKYSGRDVLQEYVGEGAKLFGELLGNCRRNTVFSLFAYQTPQA